MRILFTLLLAAAAVGLQASPVINNSENNTPESESNTSSINSHVPTGDLSGIIIDEITDEPVEFATIGVYSKEDSSLVTGSITDADGKFRIEKVPFGNYYIDVRFIGYSASTIPHVTLENGNVRVNLGSIELKKSTENIREVEIVADHAAVEYKIDKKVISVGSQIAAAGGTAIDVLEGAPSVRTDVNGDVLLRGSSSFTVLIDGKPVPLEGNDALRQIPASAIQSIELITNPSVQYEPDGTAGIINVVTKKNRQAGISGVADASIHTSGEYRVSMNLNRKFKNLGLRGGISLNRRPSPYDWYREKQIVRGDTTIMNIGEGEWNWGHRGKNLNLGADYEINERNSMSLTGNAGLFRFSYDNSADYKAFNEPGPPPEYYSEDNSFYVDAKYLGLNFNFDHNFNDKGHKITLISSFSKNYTVTGNESSSTATDEMWNPVAGQSTLQRGVTDKEISSIENKLDYVLPLGQNSQFKAGYQGRYWASPEDYRWETWDPDLGQWVADPAKSSINHFSSTVNGLYTMFNNNNRIVNLQFGMRAEYSDRLIESGVDDEQYAVQRLDWYPSLNLSRKFNGGHQLQGSFSRRVQRPRQWQLWPKQTYVDPTTIWQGNPLLQPEFTNSAELNYMKEFGKSFITLETYYRQSDNEISRVFDVIENDITRQTFANLQSSKSVGSEILANVDVFKWWTVVGSVDFFRRSVDSRNIGTAERTANSWNGQFDNSFSLRSGTKIQFALRYYGEALTAQGSRDVYWMANMGIRQQLFKRKLIATLTVKDLFGTVRYNETAYGPEQYILTRQKLRGPIVGLTLSYAINNYRQRDGDIDLNVDQGGF